MTQEASETRECPYCAETIKARARVCRFCGRDLSGPETGPAVTAQQVKASSGVADGVKLGCGMFIVLPLLILAGLIAIVLVLAAIGSTM